MVERFIKLPVGYDLCTGALGTFNKEKVLVGAFLVIVKSSRPFV